MEASIDKLLKDSLSGYFLSDLTFSSSSPLRGFQCELGVQDQMGPSGTAGFTASGRTKHFDRGHDAELKH